MRRALLALALALYPLQASASVEVTYREPSTFANDGSPMDTLNYCQISIYTAGRAVLTSRRLTASSRNGGALRTVQIQMNPTETAQAQLVEIVCHTTGGTKGLTAQVIRDFPSMQPAEPEGITIVWD